MLCGIDHVVHGVRDLRLAIDAYESAGLVSVTGGAHLEEDVQSAVIPFTDGSYIDVEAFVDPEMPRHDPWWREVILRGHEGFVAYALLSDDLDADLAALRRRGLPVLEPMAHRRRAIGGPAFEVTWREISPLEQRTLPFIIQDVSTHFARVPVPGGAEVHHPVGASRLMGVTLAVDSIISASLSLERLLGQGGTLVDFEATEEGDRRRFEIGDQWIDVLQPNEGTKASEFVLMAGAGVYEVTLGDSSAKPYSKGEPLKGELHGAKVLLLHG